MSSNIPGKLRFSPATVFGDTTANDVVLEEGTLAIDVAKDVINIHDGVTKGGIKQVQTAPIGQPVLTYKTDSIESPLPIIGTYKGSASNPFINTTERDAWAAENLGTLLAGRTKRWTLPGPVEQVWVGPGARNWTAATSASQMGRPITLASLGDSTDFIFTPPFRRSSKR